MATNAQLLLGSTFSFNSVAIGEVVSVSGTFLSRKKRAVVSADSTNGVADNLKGSAEYGDLQIGVIYDPTASGDYDSLATAAAAGTEGAIDFTFPDGTKVAATSGFLADLGLPSAGDPDSEFDVSLSVTPLAAWTFTDLAS